MCVNGTDRKLALTPRFIFHGASNVNFFCFKFIVQRIDADDINICEARVIIGFKCRPIVRALTQHDYEHLARQEMPVLIICPDNLSPSWCDNIPLMQQGFLPRARNDRSWMYYFLFFRFFSSFPNESNAITVLPSFPCEARRNTLNPTLPSVPTFSGT